jgi:hypothetical protein
VPASARCGRPAERPVIASGVIAGREEEHLPVCADCLQLPLEDVRRFWEGLSRGRQPPPPD